MKLSRYKKLTVKLLVVYIAIVSLVAYAHPVADAVTAAGVALVAAGEILRIWAAGHLVKNKELTTTGPYAHVKNPLYLGTFLIMVGLALIARTDPASPGWERHANWILLGIGCVVFVIYYAPYKSKREGGHLREKFGEAWEDYDRNVPDYFPTLRKYPRGTRRFTWAMVGENSEQWTLLAVATGLVVLAYAMEVRTFLLGVVK